MLLYCWSNNNGTYKFKSCRISRKRWQACHNIDSNGNGNPWWKNLTFSDNIWWENEPVITQSLFQKALVLVQKKNTIATLKKLQNIWKKSLYHILMKKERLQNPDQFALLIRDDFRG